MTPRSRLQWRIASAGLWVGSHADKPEYVINERWRAGFLVQRCDGSEVDTTDTVPDAYALAEADWNAMEVAR